MTDAPDAIPAIGGAMDLAVGARNVLVMMEHTTKAGEPKLLQACSYPLTAAGVVDTVYTNWAIVDVKNGRFVLRSMVAGMTVDALQRSTGAKLWVEDGVETIVLDASGRAGIQP